MTRRVLVVDDDRMMAQTLREILEMHDWTVDVAHDGRTAVAKAAGVPYDVVLMDVKMPGLDGVSAFKAMKRARPEVRVVLMTAFAADSMISEAEDEGVLRVLTKPVNVRSLLAYLAGVLSRQRPVLLVDNDAAFLRTLSDSLRVSGFETIVAGSLDEAIRLVRTNRPAAILLHMHLGRASARDAVLAVRDISPGTALILYSGRPGAEGEIDDGVPREYIHSYLQKPFAVEQLTEVLQHAIED